MSDAMSDAHMEGVVMSENIIVQRQVMASPGALEVQTRHQVDMLAASQQLTYDQLKQFWDEHQALRRDSGEALGPAATACDTGSVTRGRGAPREVGGVTTRAIAGGFARGGAAARAVTRGHRGVSSAAV